MALVLESLDYYETIICYILIGSEQLLKCCAEIIHRWNLANMPTYPTECVDIYHG